MLGFNVGDKVEIIEGVSKGKTGHIQKTYKKHIEKWDMDDILFDIKIHKGKTVKGVAFGDFKKVSKGEI